MNDVQDLLSDSDPLIAKTATKVLRINEMLHEGQITKAQHDELCRNMLQLDEIHHAMDDLARKQRIVKAFQRIVAVAGITQLF